MTNPHDPPSYTMLDNMLVPIDDLDPDSPWDDHPEFGACRIILVDIDTDGQVAIGAFNPDGPFAPQLGTMLIALTEFGMTYSAGTARRLDPTMTLSNARSYDLASLHGPVADMVQFAEMTARWDLS